MARASIKSTLEKLLNKELSSSTNNKKQVISAYKTLIDVLKTPQLNKQIQGHQQLIFECLSQIFLTPFHQYFDDDQLRELLELASNACVLSMSQNQIIDGWLQNIDERTFEKPDNDDENEDDDDDLYEDATDSEEIEEEEEEDEQALVTIINNAKKPKRRQQTNSNSAPVKVMSPPPAQPKTDQRNAHVAHSRGHRGGHQNSPPNDVSKPVKGGDNRRGAKGGNDTNNVNKRLSDRNKGKGQRPFPFDNKYGVDLRLYDCYICGEYGHVQYDCPKKQTKPKQSSRGGFNNKKQTRRSKSSSSSSSGSSINVIPVEIDQKKTEQVYNQATKLLNSSLTTDERKKTFDLFISHVENLRKQIGTNLSKIFEEKESIFYPLYCHVAQNDFLFTNDQYEKLYNLRHVLLSYKENFLNEDRSIFSRQRILISLKLLSEHIKNVTQIQQTYFNDFQEYIIRSITPISIHLYDLIKYLLKSNIHIDFTCFEYFTKRILFDLKKDIFSNEQVQELQTYVDIRLKRLEHNNRKNIWKERFSLFKNEKLTIDINPWISELEQILKINDNEHKEATNIVVNNPMWYFGILIMCSSGHLNKEQYENLLNNAIQSPLFNSIQTFYFQFYLNHGQAPIMIKELNQIKILLESYNKQEKELGYEHIKNILDRPKPQVDQKEIQQSSSEVEGSTQTDNQSKTLDDIVPIVDNRILSRLISLVEMICSDNDAFSYEQCKELLDKFLHQSTIVIPLPTAEQQRLTSFYSRPISLNELKAHCSSMDSDLTNFLSLLKTRKLTNTDETIDYLTETLVNIFKNRRKYSNDQCQELKSLLQKQTFGRKRYQLIHKTFQDFRVNQKNPPPINPIILNQLLTNILLHDYQAHLEFFTLLEELSQTFDLNELTIEYEINRCLLSTMILVITEEDFTNSTNINFFRQRLKTIVEKENHFICSLLTQQQYQLILTRLTLTSKIDPLIDSIKNDFDEKHFSNLIHFIKNELKDKIDFEKLINFILYTFDQQILNNEQTLQIINLILQHNKTFKNLLQFLLDLLKLNIHSSPKVFLNLIENNQDNDQTIEQILIMLNTKNGKYAIADWKRTMIQLLTILFNREQNYDQLRTIAQQSPLLQMATFKQQLEAYWKKTSDNQSDENKQPSTTQKTTKKSDNSSVHREMFHNLESGDPSKNKLVVQQLRTSLLNEQLPPEILLPKFIQALQTIFKNSQKYKEISLDEWETLITKNRGKIFSSDAQCDQLLLNILFARLNMANDTLNSIQRTIQSKKAHERHDGLTKLLSLLKHTQLDNGKNKNNYLPTISSQLFDTIICLVHNQKFNDEQVRQCFVKATNSWLLNDDQRQKLNI